MLILSLVPLVFTVIGIICAVTGSVFASALGGYFTILMASLLMVMGLKIIGVIDFELPVIIKLMPANSTSSLFLYPASSWYNLCPCGNSVFNANSSGYHGVCCDG